MSIMPEKSEDENAPAENGENCADEAAEPERVESGSYYYDDAFGYETFVPDDDEES